MAEERHRVVVFGAGRVGKTAIVNRFLHGTFPEHYKQTVEDLHCREYDIKGAILKVDVLDTSGELAFPAMRRLSISNAHAFILVYSIDSPGSFEVVKQIWDQIKEQRSNYQDLPCVFVGNKDDLDNKRQVEYDTAQAWARSEGMESAFMEVSAKMNRDIHIIFHKLLDQANIPELRKLEPILKRRLSANSGHMAGVRDRLRIQDGEGKGFSRSRSLIRRSNKPKLKQTGDPSRNDCVIS